MPAASGRGEPMVSPYLTKPLRTVEEVARELEEARRRRLARKGGWASLEPGAETPGAKGSGSTPRAKTMGPEQRAGPRPHID